LTGEPAQEANMAHFTQLGLSGSPDKKPEAKPQGETLPSVSSEKQRPRSNDKKPGGKEKTAVLVFPDRNRLARGVRAGKRLLKRIKQNHDRCPDPERR